MATSTLRQPLSRGADRCWIAVLASRASLLACCAACVVLWPTTARTTEPAATAERTAPRESETSAQRGYRLVRTKAYLPAEFPEAAFENIWRTWPEPLLSEAERADAAERRRMALSRYGLIPAPEDPDGIPMAYVSDGQGGWSLTCLSCHGGKVAGQSIPGLGNSHFAFQTLTHEVIRSWMRLDGDRPEPWQLSRLTAPLGLSNGTTDAQVFSVQLTALRDDEMNVRYAEAPPHEHHDLDAPPFWNVRKRKRLYIDGFAEKTPRTIMQFALYPNNDADTIKGWEGDFRDILAWIESVEPPPYPGPIDRPLAARGRALFEQHCADCHGTYGPNGTYPERTVPIDELGTDSLRLTGMPPEHRRRFGRGWLGEGGRRTAIAEPEGYVAPPLDGIWASAPYLHNGSVPTLWHLFHPGQRPKVWLRTEDGYDHRRVGLEVTEFETVPPKAAANGAEKRRYFDTRIPGKSAAGHDYPDALAEDEKVAVIEYLKTL